MIVVGGGVREMALLNPGRPKEVGFQTLDPPLPPPPPLPAPFLTLTVASVGGPELEPWRGGAVRPSAAQCRSLIYNLGQL